MIKNDSVYSYVKRKLPNIKIYIGFIFVLKILFLALSLISPILYQLLIDEGFAKKNGNMVFLIIVGNIFVFLLESLLSFVEMRLGIKYNNLLKLNISTSILNKFLKIPYFEYEKYDIGEVKKLIDEESGILTKYIQSQIIDKIYNYILLISSTIFMILNNIWLAIFAWAMIPLSFLITKLLSKKSKELNEKWRNDWSDYESWLINNLNSWKEVKINNYAARLSRIFIRKWKKLCALFLKKQILFIANYSLNDFKDTFIIKMNIYFLGAIFIINGHMAVGALLAFMQYYEKAISSVSQINGTKFALSEMQPAIDRIMEIDQPIISPEFICPKTYDIKLEDVSFSYTSDGNSVLSHISLHIPYGTNVLIQGTSGVGKTTLIKLILGLYEPNEGKVLIGDLPVSTIAKLNNDITLGAVMQDNILFGLSIIDNFKLIKSNITEQDVINACNKAHINDFINSLPEKYNTILYENSNNISGGQKQRLSLAMVIAQNPLIVILDEVTSALDIETETTVREVIKNEFRNKTIINISHTYDDRTNFDMILNIKNGNIE